MNIISLETKNTTYQIGIHDHGFLFHLYYGPKTKGDTSLLLTKYFRGGHGVPYDMREDRTFSPDALPMEYSIYGNGDYRSHALRVREEDGTSAIDCRYVSHKFYDYKYSIPGLPASYGEAKTLEIITRDERVNVDVILRYGIFYEEDVITRTVEIRNNSSSPIFINKVMSLSLDMLTGNYELIHFWGKHFNEMNEERTPIGHESLRIGSQRGVTGHQHNNGVLLVEKDTSEDYGNAYAFSLVYSGNFLIEAEKDQYSTMRFQMGIGDEGLDYRLETSSSFYAPEAIMAFSPEGMGGVSYKISSFIREHICRGKYKKIRRPIIVNNWEATYFDFTGKKLIEIAREAANLGIEMFVLDDGWFGSRGPDTKGLGDWFVNEEKMGGPLRSVVDSINKMGVKFGLWIEPEMVNEDSLLFKEHPDWAFIVPGKPPVEGRCQLVLDFTRLDVRTYILEKICNVIDSANIEYVKIDMNRSICEIFSHEKQWQNFGELSYRYTLGVYDFLDKLTSRYPNILFEGCSSGGARFDAGLMYYTPQIWTSDNTDCVERARIQYAASYIYPISTFGSHVSAIPNHQNGRITPLSSRANVAMNGNFGYELDLTKMTEKEKEEVKEEIIQFKEYWPLIHNGRLYRDTKYEEKDELIAWNYVNEDNSEALLFVIKTNTHGNSDVSYVKCKGLDKASMYKLNGKEYSGATLSFIGIPLPIENGEYLSYCYHLERVK